MLTCTIDFHIYIMAPSTPKKVSKTKTNSKKLIYDQAALDQKMYFLWLHLQLKQDNKVFDTL